MNEGLGGERGDVIGVVLPGRETAPQKYLAFRRIFVGGRGDIPGDGSVLEVQPDRGRESEGD